MAAQMGRPAVCTMSCTRKSSQPELSPRGAEIKRRQTPLNSRPAGEPVCRSNRSMRPRAEVPANPIPPAWMLRGRSLCPCVEALGLFLPWAELSKSSPRGWMLTSSCQGEDVSVAAYSALASPTAWAALDAACALDNPSLSDKVRLPIAWVALGGACAGAAPEYTTKSGRTTSPVSGKAASNSFGSGASSVPA